VTAWYRGLYIASIVYLGVRTATHARAASVFATRSPDRPNPLGLYQVTVRDITGTRLRVGPIDASDGTPVVDIKPVLTA
jgi:tRNA (Thr-GGU) A37 N-methylase